MRIEKLPFFSKITLRIASQIALVAGLISFGWCFWFEGNSFGFSVMAGSGVLLSIFILTYLFTYHSLHDRLETLNRITHNISRKQFEDYENVRTHRHDEMDYLIKQSVRASKTVEREIQRLNRIENYRKEFIGDISHELKTPIFAIQGFIETLLNGALEDKEVNRDFLKKAMRNVNRLIYLTKDLMEISKLETGELKSEVQEVHLKDIVNEIVESLQYKAQKENVSLHLGEIDYNIRVRVDRNQIKQVLINLIENAIKYNKPEGTVTVGSKPYLKNNQKILMYVQDTGIGIDDEHLQRVTERFFRVDKSRSREKGGTGLGLSIVKHIMEAHGERLFIDSQPGKGSTFSFTLTKVD